MEIEICRYCERRDNLRAGGVFFILDCLSFVNWIEVQIGLGVAWPSLAAQPLI